MDYSDLKKGTRIRALSHNCECWSAGDTFYVQADHKTEFWIACAQGTHFLDPWFLENFEIADLTPVEQP